MYTLYVNRKENKIEINKARNIFQHLNYTDEVTRYNDSYYICSKRKSLKDKAKEVHQEWISELEEKLKLVKEIKI